MDNFSATITKKFSSLKLNKVFISVLVLAVVLGVLSGYMLSRNGSSGGVLQSSGAGAAVPPKNAAQDTRTFRDFAEGVIQVMPTPKISGTYVEGTHLLVRNGAVPVALTSSVVDLNQYVGKKVKVYGETQKALKVGWLMDVGRVEVEQ